MNTRRAKEGSPFRQERYASSQSIVRPLSGKLVALRCQAVRNDPDRHLVLWLQEVSMQIGGLEKFSEDFIQKYAQRIGTNTMRKLGKPSSGFYTSEQVRRIREEIPGGLNRFLLFGEETLMEAQSRRARKLLSEESDNWGDDESFCDPVSPSRRRPDKIAYDVFWDLCERQMEGLSRLLAEICLDSKIDIESLRPWYFPDLIQTLRDEMEERRPVSGRDFAETLLLEQAHNAFTYSREFGEMTVLACRPGTGATFAARTWCQQNPGQARIISIPATNDDHTFFKAIAKELGIASCNTKCNALRSLIEAALYDSKLMLIFDNAQFAFPQTKELRSLPKRINWISSALADRGLPVCMMVTPSFFREQRAIENRTGWLPQQFENRISFFEELPHELSKDELIDCARIQFQNICPGAEKIVGLFASTSGRQLGGITSCLKMGLHLARKAGRDTPGLKDFSEAARGVLGPSLNAIDAIKNPPRRQGGSARKVPAANSTQRAGSAPAAASPPRRSTGAELVAQGYK